MSANAEAPGVDELAVLFPDVDVEVRDPETGGPVALTVREFRFLDGLRAQSVAAPFTKALAELIGTAPEAEVDDAAVADLMAEHAETWLTLVARACDRPVEWVARLADADADRVSEAMWSANAGFFMRRVVASAVTRQRKAQSPSPSVKSSTPSSAPATARDTPTSQTD